MIDTRTSRLTATVLLLGVVVSVLVAYGTLVPNPESGRYPGVEDVLQEPDRYIDERVLVDGTAVGTEPLVIDAPYTLSKNGTSVSGSAEFTISNSNATVTQGDYIQVFGTLTDQRHVRASNTVVIPAGNFRVMYVVSFLAGLWVLTRLFRHWKFTADRFSIEPRATPLALQAGFESGQTSEEDDDA